MKILNRYQRIRQERICAEESAMRNALQELGISRASEAGPRRIATVLSFLVPGSGQIYRGHIALGFVWLVIVVGGYVHVPVLAMMAHIACVFQAHSLKVDKDVSDFVSQRVG